MGAALGHPDAGALAPAGCEPEPWLLQARAFASEGRLAEASGAVSRAASCGADPTRVAIARALTTAGPGRHDALVEAVQRAPQHAGVRLALARTLAECGAVADAREHAALGLAAVGHPQPDDVLFVASIQADPAAALAVLEDGLRRGGPSPAVREAAARAEVALGSLEAALARVDGLDPHAAALRARLTALAGDARARAAYDRALLAVQGAPRQTPAMRALADVLGAEREALP